jgi:hypothetical protein
MWVRVEQDGELMVSSGRLNPGGQDLVKRKRLKQWVTSPKSLNLFFSCYWEFGSGKWHNQIFVLR